MVRGYNIIQFPRSNIDARFAGEARSGPPKRQRGSSAPPLHELIGCTVAANQRATVKGSDTLRPFCEITTRYPPLVNPATSTGTEYSPG